MSVALTAILGSATPPGRLRRAVTEALARATDDGEVAVTFIDLAEREIAAADGRPADQLGDDTAAVVTAIGSADAVLLATPVYRGSFTGVLKNLLDHVPVESLERKPTAIVAMGATQHHFLGAERHLRDVLAFFGAAICPVAVYLSSADFEDGAPLAAVEDQLDALLVELTDLAAAAPGQRADRLPPLAARRPR